MSRILAALVCVFGALPLRAAEDGIFVDVAASAGLDFVYFNGMTGAYLMPEIVGGGGALLDYDNDGDLDVFLVQGSMLEAGRDPGEALLAPRGGLGDRLFRNDLVGTGEGRLRFTDVTQAAGLEGGGYGIGVATADFDNDGWVDVYVTSLGSNRLLRNRGDGRFADVTRTSGTDDPRWSVPAVFFDYDRDGWLDLFVGNYLDYRVANDKPCRSLSGAVDYCGPLSYEPVTDRLWRNRGDGSFEDVTLRAGLGGAAGSTLGAISGDFDEDGWPDLYVANDGLANRMWMNRGDGSFVDDALLAGAAVNMMGRPEASMGVAAGDYDNDGDEDLFLTHLRAETNTLYRNGGEGFFEDLTVATDLGAPSWTATGFGTVWIDYDNDGTLDLFVANGAVNVPERAAASPRVFPLDEPNQLFRNLGDGRFADVSSRGGAVMRLSEVSRGVASGDVDNDGDTDLLLVNNSGPTRLLLNQVGSKQSWIGVRALAGDPPRDSLGARVGVRLPDGTWRWRRVRTDGSYVSGSDPRVLFGLGSASGAVEVVVVWPDGAAERWSVAVGRHVDLRRGTGERVEASP